MASTALHTGTGQQGLQEPAVTVQSSEPLEPPGGATSASGPWKGFQPPVEERLQGRRVKKCRGSRDSGVRAESHRKRDPPSRAEIQPLCPQSPALTPTPGVALHWPTVRPAPLHAPLRRSTRALCMLWTGSGSRGVSLPRRWTRVVEVSGRWGRASNSVLGPRG